jgi:hypothetical protein
MQTWHGWCNGYRWPIVDGLSIVCSWLIDIKKDLQRLTVGLLCDVLSGYMVNKVDRRNAIHAKNLLSAFIRHPIAE